MWSKQIEYSLRIIIVFRFEFCFEHVLVHPLKAISTHTFIMIYTLHCIQWNLNLNSTYHTPAKSCQRLQIPRSFAVSELWLGRNFQIPRRPVFALVRNTECEK